MSSAVETAVETAVRSRPRDRRQRIADAAAVLFAERGYHQVGIGDVAGAVGISAPAVYRHFANKYELFVRAAFVTAHRLLEATEAIASEAAPAPGAAPARLDALLGAVIHTTIELRASGGLYRWEGRYLESEDRARLTAEFGTLRERLLAAHAAYRPDLPSADRELLVWGALAVVASITAHRTVLAVASLTELLRAAAWRVLDGELPPEADLAVLDAGDGRVPRRRERIVTEAIGMFAVRGYHDVSVEQISAAVGLTPSGLYRHFPSKSAILLEACQRAADRLENGMREARESAQTASALEAMRFVAGDYVRRSVENHQLIRVYFADLGSLPPEDQRRVRGMQRAYLGEWAELLQLARPGLGVRDATVLVHAGFGVVADLGLVAHRSHRDLTERVTRVLELALGVA